MLNSKDTKFTNQLSCQKSVIMLSFVTFSNFSYCSLLAITSPLHKLKACIFGVQLDVAKRCLWYEIKTLSSTLHTFTHEFLVFILLLLPYIYTKSYIFVRICFTSTAMLMIFVKNEYIFTHSCWMFTQVSVVKDLRPSNKIFFRDSRAQKRDK